MIVLPIGDSPNLPKTPWVTWGLIAVNVLIYLALWPAAWTPADPRSPEVREYLQVLAVERGVRPAAVSVADVVQFRYGAKPGDLEVSDVFASMFLHGGLLHLLGNMLFLWIFGDNVEHRLGGPAFLLAYLGTGVAAVLGDAALRWGSEIPSVGASGAISGILGCYFAWFPHNRVRMWGFFFPFFLGTFELSARFVLGMFLVLDNLLPLLIAGGGGGISYGAHIGGFVAGWGLAHVLAAPAVPLRAPRRRTGRDLDVYDKTVQGELLEEAGQARPALAAYQRALADHPRDPGRAAAHLGAARVLMRGLGSPTAAYQHLYAVLEEGASPDEVEEARALLAELRGETRTLPRRHWG